MFQESFLRVAENAEKDSEPQINGSVIYRENKPLVIWKFWKLIQEGVYRPDCYSDL